jgi:hypothetical protein
LRSVGARSRPHLSRLNLPCPRYNGWLATVVPRRSNLVSRWQMLFLASPQYRGAGSGGFWKAKFVGAGDRRLKACLFHDGIEVEMSVDRQVDGGLSYSQFPMASPPLLALLLQTSAEDSGSGDILSLYAKRAMGSVPPRSIVEEIISIWAMQRSTRDVSIGSTLIVEEGSLAWLVAWRCVTSLPPLTYAASFLVPTPMWFTSTIFPRRTKGMHHP